jgi:hypothetical protein
MSIIRFIISFTILDLRYVTPIPFIVYVARFPRTERHGDRRHAAWRTHKERALRRSGWIGGVRERMAISPVAARPSLRGKPFGTAMVETLVRSSAQKHRTGASIAPFTSQSPNPFWKHHLKVSVFSRTVCGEGFEPSTQD